MTIFWLQQWDAYVWHFHKLTKPRESNGPDNNIVGRICNNLGPSRALCEENMKICSGFFWVCWLQKLREPRRHSSGPPPPKNSKFKMATENLINFHNSASNCLFLHWFWWLNPCFGGQGIQWNIQKLNMYSYVVIQIPKFHIFIKTWLIVRCDLPKTEKEA